MVTRALIEEGWIKVSSNSETVEPTLSMVTKSMKDNVLKAGPFQGLCNDLDTRVLMSYLKTFEVQHLDLDDLPGD